MDRQTRWRLGLPVGFVLVGLAVGYAVARSADEPALEGPGGEGNAGSAAVREGEDAAQQARSTCCAEKKEPAGDRVIFPPDRAVLLSGSFDVICTMGDEEVDLQVDGQPRAWEPFEPPVHVAHLRLAPGFHELRIGGRQRQIVVALNEMEHDGPADWPLYRRHEMSPDLERCGDCHTTKRRDGRVAVGKLKPHGACFECHERVDFEAAHEQPLEAIRRCETCHALHASKQEALLKAPAEELCRDRRDA